MYELIGLFELFKVVSMILGCLMNILVLLFIVFGILVFIGFLKFGCFIKLESVLDFKVFICKEYCI